MLLVSIVSAYATERKYDFVVAQDGSGDFTTIQEAINAVPDFRKANRTNILIKKGNYKEKLIIPECKIKLTLTGEDGAVITYDDYASKTQSFRRGKIDLRLCFMLYLCTRFHRGKPHFRKQLRTCRAGCGMLCQR